MLLRRLASLCTMILVLTSFRSTGLAKGMVPDAHPSIPVDRLELAAPGDPYPGSEWPAAPIPPFVDYARLSRATDAGFAEGDGIRALLIVYHGVLVYERYAQGFAPQSRFPSGAIAASVTGAATGLLVRDGRLKLDQPAPVPAWRKAADARSSITIAQLLQMTSGIEWKSAPDLTASDDGAMLYGAGRADMARSADAKPLTRAPGSAFQFNAGTTLVLDGIVGRIIAPYANGDERRAAVRNFFNARLFEPIGVKSAVMEFDTAGNFVGSSFLHMTARDYARFGYLYLRDGEWDGAPLLPPDWVKFTSSASPSAKGDAYGAHFWRCGRVADGFPALALGPSSKAFEALGEGGQVVLIVPEESLVIVRLGHSPEAAWPGINQKLAGIIASFAAPASPANFLQQQNSD